MRLVKSKNAASCAPHRHRGKNPAAKQLLDQAAREMEFQGAISMTSLTDRSRTSWGFFPRIALLLCRGSGRT